MKLSMSLLITPVPPELRGRFDDMQLRNSVRRIFVLTLIVLFAKLANGLFALLAKESFMSLSDYCDIANIAVFYLMVILFRKRNVKSVLWGVCYLCMAGSYLVYAHEMSTVGAVANIPFMFFITVFLFTIIPDFKPRIFISFALLYFLAVVFILLHKGQSAGEYSGLHSQVFNIFAIVLVTKILLYNGKVKTFVNTFEINKLNENLVAANKEIGKQKDELKNYNDNLEGMIREKTKTIVELKNAVMETIAEMVERRDDATGGHITRTSGQLKVLIDAVLASGLYREQAASWNIEQMIMSAQLHDVGKIGIDDSILRKPARLTEEEFEAMKKHTVIGGEIIREIQKKTGEVEFLNYAYTFAVYHHEKWNGSGYPYGMAGEDIPLPARLMAIVDVYDALISERPYKKAFTHEEAVKIIMEGSGSHFDPSLAELFLSVSDRLAGMRS